MLARSWRKTQGYLAVSFKKKKKNEAWITSVLILGEGGIGAQKEKREEKKDATKRHKMMQTVNELHDKNLLNGHECHWRLLNC